MGHLLFQLSLTLWNNKTNHIILSVPIKIRHIDDVLSIKRNVRLVASLKEFYIQNLMNFRSVANARDEHGVKSIEQLKEIHGRHKPSMQLV